MSSRPLSDEQLVLALRAYLPKAAPSGSAERLAEAIATQRQERRLPIVVAQLRDVDPIGRRRSVVLAVALLVIAAVVGGIATGAWRPRFVDPLRDLGVDPPGDVQAYAVSIVQDSPVVRPMAITLVADGAPSSFGGRTEGPVKTRIFMDGAGSVRIEHFATLDDTEPQTYRLINAGRIVELAKQGDERVWIEERSDGDPRAWVFNELAAYMGNADNLDCEMTTPDPASAWRYIGLERVVDRPAHHIFCGGEFWVDVETRLILRSRGPLTADGRPVADTTRTIEVIALDLGDQPRALFDLVKPTGIRTVTRDEQVAYQEAAAQEAACAADPVCAAPEVTLPTPPAAEGAEPPAPVDQIVAAAVAARVQLRPVQITIERSRSRGGVIGNDRLLFERPDLFRVERAEDRLAEIPAGTSIWSGERGVWDMRTDERGTTTWLRFTNGRNIGDAAYMWLEETLFVLPECGPVGGLADGVDGPRWRHLGVDRVGAFIADHITCGDAEKTWNVNGDQYGCGCAGSEFWIDRDTHLVVRRVRPGEGGGPSDVREVVDLEFTRTPQDLFHPPAGATVDVQATPDPRAQGSPPPQPAPSDP